MQLQSCGKAKPIKTDVTTSGEGVKSWKARILLAGRPKGTENTLAFSYKFKHVPIIGSRKPTCRCSPNRTKAKDLAKLCLQKPLCSGREPNTKDDSEGWMSARRWLGLFLALLSPQAQPTTAHGQDTAGPSQDKGEAAAPLPPGGQDRLAFSGVAPARANATPGPKGASSGKREPTVDMLPPGSGAPLGSLDAIRSCLTGVSGAAVGLDPQEADFEAEERALQQPGLSDCPCPTWPESLAWIPGSCSAPWRSGTGWNSGGGADLGQSKTSGSAGPGNWRVCQLESEPQRALMDFEESCASGRHVT